jgi:hypothetical protein
MTGCLKSILWKVAVVGGLVLAAYAGWRWGPQVFPQLHDWLGWGAEESSVGPEPTPELADSVLAQVQVLRRGDAEAPLVLGSGELTSVVRYGAPSMIPDGISEPLVTLVDGRVHVQARVTLEAFPELPDLGPIIGFLPDTLDVSFEASLMPFGDRRAALLLHGIEASRIPLPRRLIPDILGAMGRRDEAGLPPEAILVPLPSGLASAYILTDSLILSRDP